MKQCMKTVAGSLLLFLLAGPAWAQDDDMTMEVVEDPAADENEYVDEIALPSEADPEAHENAAFGIDTANKARKLTDDIEGEGRDFGQAVSERAKELGRDAGNARKAVDGTGSGRPADLPVQAQ